MGPSPLAIAGVSVVAVAGTYYAMAGRSAPANHVFTTMLRSNEVKLVEARDITHNVRYLRFAFADPNQVSGLPVGSAVIAQATRPGKWFPTLRPYTPTSDLNEKGALEFNIKRYENGAVSNYLSSLKVGDKMTFRGPLPSYDYKPNMHKQIGLVAGGAGITPCYQLIRNVLKDPQDQTKLSLVFANSTEDDLMLKDELDTLARDSKGRFSVYYTVSRPSDSWTQGKGRVNKAMLQQNLPAPSDDKTQIFVCGPDGFYETVSGAKTNPMTQGTFGGILKELGYTQKQVHKF